MNKRGSKVVVFRHDFVGLLELHHLHHLLGLVEPLVHQALVLYYPVTAVMIASLPDLPVQTTHQQKYT